MKFLTILLLAPLASLVAAQDTHYISYGALNRNGVPCSRLRCQYYLCQLPAVANDYVRGCSSITRCRSDVGALACNSRRDEPFDTVEEIGEVVV
ncbi:hypothetical protein PVAG01_03314 [Phlyctema vagabunda]|uniref:Uncharacterized protein n=1 Tax=Phlyctema vagabunda TaxID=108571 RepID=A0ABR4PL33_9HELO